MTISPPATFGSEVWGGAKVLWALSPDAGGLALVRGRQLDGDAELRFDTGANPSPDKVLDAAQRTALDGGWRDFPSYTRVTRPGCYGFQIDTAAGSDTIVFVAD